MLRFPTSGNSYNGVIPTNDTLRSHNWAPTIPLMGNETADLIRTELGKLLIYRYGDLKRASAEIGIPYKTLYRAVTTTGKDRVQRIPLDTVIEVSDALGITIADLYTQSVSGTDYALAAKTRSKNRGETD